MNNINLLKIKKFFKNFSPLILWKKIIFSVFNIKKNMILRVV